MALPFLLLTLATVSLEFQSCEGPLDRQEAEVYRMPPTD